VVPSGLKPMECMVMNFDLASVAESRTVILVEGTSDQAALEALADRRGQALDTHGVAIVQMGGATNIGRFLRLFGPRGLGVRLAGLCDLEDELIRALGVASVEHIIQAHGEIRSFRVLQKQPAQRGRTPERQLHRFMGTRAGRKSQYARLLVDALDLARVPRPLDQVLAHSTR